MICKGAATLFYIDVNLKISLYHKYPVLKSLHQPLIQKTALMTKKSGLIDDEIRNRSLSNFEAVKELIYAPYLSYIRNVSLSFIFITSISKYEHQNARYNHWDA